jgi:hypothetical protein
VLARWWLSSGALDPDLTAGDDCKRRAAVLSRRRAAAAALGGSLAGARPKRARGLGLPRGFHLDEECDATNSTEATRTAS